MERASDTALVPCGHLLCGQCARALPTQQCPFDRRAFSATQVIFAPN
jgi:hypothetical protein